MHMIQYVFIVLHQDAGLTALSVVLDLCRGKRIISRWSGMQTAENSSRSPKDRWQIHSCVTQSRSYLHTSTNICPPSVCPVLSVRLFVKRSYWSRVTQSCGTFCLLIAVFNPGQIEQCLSEDESVITFYLNWYWVYCIYEEDELFCRNAMIQLFPLCTNIHNFFTNFKSLYHIAWNALKLFCNMRPGLL